MAPSNDVTRLRKTIHGQAMFEYLWLCVVLLLALTLPWLDGRSPAEAVLAAIVHRIERFVGWLAVI
jgi:hypothetical protein